VVVVVKLEYVDALDVLLNPQTTLRIYSNEVVAFAAVVVAEQYVVVPPVIDMVMPLLVAEAGTAHVALDVITQVTIAPLVRVEVL
jgi:hypothetical protein